MQKRDARNRAGPSAPRAKRGREVAPRRALALMLAAACLWPLVRGSANAVPGSEMAALCETAAGTAARQTGVPFSVLRALMLTETGRELGGALRPWPWAVNMEGKGLWFESAAAAKAYASEHFERGARSFDVGCFQINYRWHHQAFSSLEAMFDPQANALYAARFLKRLFDEKNDWVLAAGAYHSRSPEHAEPYRARFSRIHAALRDDDIPLAPVGRAAMAIGAGPAAAPLPAAPPQGRRENTFPLLRAGTPGGLGSLVPLAAAPARPRLFADDAGGP